MLFLAVALQNNEVAYISIDIRKQYFHDNNNLNVKIIHSFSCSFRSDAYFLL